MFGDSKSQGKACLVVSNRISRNSKREHVLRNAAAATACRIQQKGKSWLGVCCGGWEAETRLGVAKV